MSLLTRCPACETLFKLVSDQLRISQGWVKCGQCGEIFDASKHLIQVAVDPVLTPAENTAIPAGQTTVNTTLPLVAVVAEVSADVADCAPLGHETVMSTVGVTESEAPGTTGDEMASVPLAAVEPAPIAETLGSPTPTEVSQQTPETFAPDAVEVADTKDQKAPMAIELLTDAAPLLTQQPSPEPASEAPKVSFLGDSRRHSVWQSRGGRLVLWLAMFLLGSGLWLQWLYWERDRLAATYPDQKPLLQQMCQALNCSIQTLQRIDAIAIDSAAFSRLGPDSYRLSFVIKNLANLEVALPSVELMLTDTQDQVMVRRALLPSELFAVTPALLPGTELPVNLVLGVDLGDAAPHVIGYRLLAFYP